MLFSTHDNNDEFVRTVKLIVKYMSIMIKLLYIYIYNLV